MRMNRLLPAVLAGCLLLVVLLAGAAAGATAGADDLTLYEIDNPAGSADYWIRWSAVTDTITYTLQEGDSPAFIDPMLRYMGELTGTMVTGQAGGTWYYRVKATTSGGDTPWSNVVSTTVAPLAPVLNPITNPEHTSAYVVEWQPAVGAITYTLEEDSSAAFGSPAVRFQGVLTSFEVIDQGAGTWYYRVKAANEGGESPWSNVEATEVWMAVHVPLVVKRWPPLPYAPTLAPITDPEGDGAYTVSWIESPKRLADTYTLQEATSPGFTANLRTACTTAQQSCPVTGRPVGTYYYRVRGTNAWGTGDWSATRSVTVVPPELLINGDFEQGWEVGWEEYSTHGWAIILPFQYLPEAPHSGNWAAWLGGDNEELSLVAQEVTIQSGAPYLVYWYWINSEDECGYDFGGVVVNNATVVDIFDLCAAQNTHGWVRRSVNLSAYVGQTILFDIRTETDEALISNMLLDDVSLAASPAGAGPAPAGTEKAPMGAKAGRLERPGRMVPGEMSRVPLLEDRPE
jgi:hypothetical protein